MQSFQYKYIPAATYFTKFAIFKYFSELKKHIEELRCIVTYDWKCASESVVVSTLAAVVQMFPSP